LPFVRKRGAFIFAIVSNERARLAKAADAFILLHVERELCPYDLAPTTSTVAQLLFGDLLAMALMRKRQVSLQEYALNHPGGLIGRRISLRVADLMVKGEMLPFALPHQRLIEVLHELSAKQCGCLLIVDEEKRLKGIFTDGDLRRALELKGAHALEHLLEHIMTLHPRFTLPGTLAIEAMRQMEEDVSKLITVLPVVEEDQVVGLLRMHDILQAGFYTAPAPQK
jgi:arabinose-5-phosphate isomerase